MPARLMHGKSNIIIDYLKKKNFPKNIIQHLIDNRNHLSIISIKVETRDHEEYELPYEFVYIVKDDKNENRT